MNPDPSPPAIACIIVAAGRGLRDACDVRPDAIVRGLGELRGAFPWRP